MLPQWRKTLQDQSPFLLNLLAYLLAALLLMLKVMQDRLRMCGGIVRSSRDMDRIEMGIQLRLYALTPRPVTTTDTPTDTNVQSKITRVTSLSQQDGDYTAWIVIKWKGVVERSSATKMMERLPAPSDLCLGQPQNPAQGQSHRLEARASDSARACPRIWSQKVVRSFSIFLFITAKTTQKPANHAITYVSQPDTMSDATMTSLALQHTSSSGVESKAPPETQGAKSSSPPFYSICKVALPCFGQRDNDKRVKANEQKGGGGHTFVRHNYNQRFGTLSLGVAHFRIDGPLNQLSKIILKARQPLTSPAILSTGALVEIDLAGALKANEVHHTNTCSFVNRLHPVDKLNDEAGGSPMQAKGHLLAKMKLKDLTKQEKELKSKLQDLQGPHWNMGYILSNLELMMPDFTEDVGHQSNSAILSKTADLTVHEINDNPPDIVLKLYSSVPLKHTLLYEFTKMTVPWLHYKISGTDR
ncbi:hypothetical protein JB92DRAFT_2835441 [Gautieria morchelliformis]|nr:hypothetical protein JB92DRAFT_2835441 [Gautieria morchelliformis]